jgi:Tol biopolymer transport system component
MIVSLGLLLVAACTGPDATGREGSMMPTRSVTDPSTSTASPDPGWAAIVRSDGSTVRQVPNLPAQAFDVDLSPNGRKIAFAWEKAATPEIYSMAVDGTRRRRLTDQPGGAFGPAFSPDGRSIAYTAATPGSGWDIYLIPSTGGTPERVTTDLGIDELQPTWSADGGRIAFGARIVPHAMGIRVLEVATGRITKITHGPDSMPEWSPRGDQVSFLREPAYPVEQGFLNDLMVVQADGQDLRQLTTVDWWFDSPPYWSPDGERLSAYAAPGADLPRRGVYVFEPETGEAQQVMVHVAGGEWLPTGFGLFVRRISGRICRGVLGGRASTGIQKPLSRC